MSYRQPNMFVLKFQYDENILTARGHARLMNVLHRASAQRHLLRVMPKHFEGGAKTQPGGEYGFETRSIAWNKRKLAETGSAVPLRYKGRMREHVLNKSVVTATAKRWRIYGKNYFPLTEQRRKEIEVVSHAEQIELARWQSQQYARMARTGAYKQRRRRRVR